MKTFLLGCGAQKAGTTWLAKNLSNSPEYWNGGIKEWRFWPYYFDSNARLSQLYKLEERLLAATAPAGRLIQEKIKWRISALQYPKAFLQDIVDNFISNGKVKVLSDLTPRNGTLDIDEFAYIKAYFKESNINVKPLLIMRDPFERIWSWVRMTLLQKGC